MRFWYFADVSMSKAAPGSRSGLGLEFQQARPDYLNSTLQQTRQFKLLYMKQRVHGDTMYGNGETEKCMSQCSLVTGECTDSINGRSKKREIYSFLGSLDTASK